MKPILAIIFFTVASVCCGDTLRISELADAAADGVERMVLKTQDGEEVLFVKKKAVLGDADIDQAQPDLAFRHQINVRLNEAGGQKFKEMTSRMRHGRDRLAIIVDGRLISAPVVQDTLGSSFVICGFKDMEFRDLDDLARKLSGRPPLPEIEDPEEAAPLPSHAHLMKALEKAVKVRDLVAIESLYCWDDVPELYRDLEWIVWRETLDDVAGLFEIIKTEWTAIEDLDPDTRAEIRAGRAAKTRVLLPNIEVKGMITIKWTSEDAPASTTTTVHVGVDSKGNWRLASKRVEGGARQPATTPESKSEGSPPLPG